MILRISTVVLALLHGALLPGQERRQQRERDGLVLHYTFDARTGKVIENVVGDRLAGQRVGGLFTSTGAVGRALIVRKEDPRFGYVETADHQDLNSRKFTVAAWIKLRREGSNGSVVCKHDWLDGKSRGFVLRCYTAKCINFTIGAAGWKSTDGKTPVPPNRWVHVAGTFDGSQIRVYFNGKLEGTNKIEADYTPSPFPLRIGHAAYALEEKRKFDGQIDDVMIWNRALSEKELRTLFLDQERH